MYKIIVGESGKGRKALAASSCRISALSSADYCLHNRVEVDRNRIAWKGKAGEIRRVFEAERLNMAQLEDLEMDRDYTVVFLALRRPECA